MSDDSRSDETKTDPAPAPSESGEWRAMSDRELMLTILKKQTCIEGRLGTGNDRFDRLEADVSVLVHCVRQALLDRGRPDLAEHIDREVLARRQNGRGDDEPTDPGH